MSFRSWPRPVHATSLELAGLPGSEVPFDACSDLLEWLGAGGAVLPDAGRAALLERLVSLFVGFGSNFDETRKKFRLIYSPCSC